MPEKAIAEVLVPVEPMTAASFAPYGTVFGVHDGGPERAVADAGFWHAGGVTVGTIWNPPGETSFSRLERHYGVTQAFVQLSGSPAIICVAPPTDLHDATSLPDPASVRGFRIDPALGWQFHRGTWHALDRCVLEPPGASFMIVNSTPNPTQIIDFAKTVSERHPDLDGAPPPQALPWSGAAACRFVIDV